MKASLKSVMLSGGVLVISSSVVSNGYSNGPAVYITIGSAVCFLVSLIWWAADE